MILTLNIPFTVWIQDSITDTRTSTYTHLKPGKFVKLLDIPEASQPLTQSMPIEQNIPLMLKKYYFI